MCTAGKKVQNLSPTAARRRSVDVSTAGRAEHGQPLTTSTLSHSTRGATRRSAARLELQDVLNRVARHLDGRLRRVGHELVGPVVGDLGRVRVVRLDGLVPAGEEDDAAVRGGRHLAQRTLLGRAGQLGHPAVGVVGVLVARTAQGAGDAAGEAADAGDRRGGRGLELAGELRVLLEGHGVAALQLMEPDAEVALQIGIAEDLLDDVPRAVVLLLAVFRIAQWTHSPPI